MKNNPFSIIFGVEPENSIARIWESERIISDFSASSPASMVYVITGPRGSGKTVLMSSVHSRLSKSDNWIAVDPRAKDNLMENIASEIYETGRARSVTLEKEFSFSFSGMTFSLKGEEPAVTAYSLLRISKAGKKVLITMDEADSSEQMRLFAQGYQSLICQNIR